MADKCLYTGDVIIVIDELLHTGDPVITIYECLLTCEPTCVILIIQCLYTDGLIVRDKCL